MSDSGIHMVEVSMATETVSYYALRESGEERATGLFRARRDETGLYYEHVDRNGAWVTNLLLSEYPIPHRLD